MTNAEKLRCIERELRHRYRTYPRMVAEGTMSERTMAREFAVLEEVAADLRAAVEREERDRQLCESFDRLSWQL